MTTQTHTPRLDRTTELIPCPDCAREFRRFKKEFHKSKTPHDGRCQSCHIKAVTSHPPKARPRT